MTGKSDETNPGNPLRLNRGDGGASSGAGKCPSCGAALKADDVVCVKCGFDKRLASRIRTTNVMQPRKATRRGDGSFWAFLVFLFRLALFGAVGYGLYEGYGYYEQHWGRGVFEACPVCRGQGKTKCLTCGGFGSVETVIRKKCEQCSGTGSYSMKLKKGISTCPFCSGKGYKEQPGREDCAKCAGKGWLPCPRCEGKGRL